MDFSVKNNKLNKNNKVSFTGIKGALDAKNTQVFRFLAPAHSKDEKVALEIVPLSYNKENGEYKRLKEEDLKNIDSQMFDNSDIMDIPQELFDNFDGAFAYRYKIVDSNGNVRYALDQSKTIPLADNKKIKLNFIERGKNYGITPKNAPMYHIYRDSYGVVDEANKTLSQNSSDFCRNHFNKLGGSTKGITLMLKNTNELDPYGYIMSTPDIGHDKTSSHGYWPNNLYQCANMADFKELNLELFKRGKGYIADGAFTSQGLQSPLVHHVLRWGEESPFFNMLKFDGKPSLGILPDKSEDYSEVYKNIGVRIINNPHDVNYKLDKPTYFQFFDKRLVSEGLADETEKILDPKDFDKKPENHYEITSNDDSIYPFYFEINPNDKRLELFKNSNFEMYNTLIKKYPNFFEFEHFKIETRDKASGHTPWAGNRDIIKLNLSNPDITSVANQDGMKNARNYLYGVATFWTEAIQSNLILETAKMDDEAIKDAATINGLTEDDFKVIKQNLHTAHYPVLEQDKQIATYVSEFPLQSIETSPELSAIFAQPLFNSELFDSETLSKVSKIVNSTLDSVMDSIPANKLKPQDRQAYKTYLVKVYANDIIKNVLVGAIKPSLVNIDGSIDYDKLKEINFSTFEKSAPTSVKKEREHVVKHIKKGINQKPAEYMLDKIKNELHVNDNQFVSLDKFKLAESVVLKGRGGLNWRFDAAKDIGDLDKVMAGEADFAPIWESVEEFWGKFIGEIRQYNPSSYIVSEITDFWPYFNSYRRQNADGSPDNSEMYRYDPKIYNANIELYGKAEGDDLPHERRMPRLKEARFLENSGSTTSSNYEAGFNNLSFFIGACPEQGGDDLDKAKDGAGNLKDLKDKMDTFAFTNQPHIALYSHTFVENHDKPRISHVLPLNTELFFEENLANSEKYKELARKLTGRDDLENVSPQAVAVADVMYKEIDKLQRSEEDKEKLRNALQDLTNGKMTPSSKPSYKRARAFGVSPYEVTIRDLFEKANKFYGGLNYSDDDILAFHSSMLSNGMKKEIALWEMMNAITGIPTMFNGMEFAQTGYETPSKNQYVGNRGPILHQLNKDEKHGYKQYYDKMRAITSMYQIPGLSALREGRSVSMELIEPKYKEINFEEVENNGRLDYQAKLVASHGGMEAVKKFFDQDESKITPQAMQDTFGIWHDNFEDFKKYFESTVEIEDENGKKIKANTLETAVDYVLYNQKIAQNAMPIWPIYKADEKGSKVLSLITNNGIESGKRANESGFELKNCEFESISLKDKDGICPFEDGTELKKLVYKGVKYTPSDETYVVNNGLLTRKDGKNVTIEDTVETFYVPTNVQKQVLYNPHVRKA